MNEVVLGQFLFATLLLLVQTCGVQPFGLLGEGRRCPSIPYLQFTQSSSRLHANAGTYADQDVDSSSISIQTYEHKDWNMTYLYKPASPGHESDPPLVLVHPVGVGISSWFWTKVMSEYDNNPAIYAPDLIGCGLEHGADPWKPEETGLFFPLSWVEGVETLIDTIVLPQWQESQSPLQKIMGRSGIGNGNGIDKMGCSVVVQGGLAPVGAMLAKRNPSTVSDLIFTSPPSYKDMTTAVPQAELERNYNFLKDPIFGGIAFFILESREIVRFFSNLFLFMDECDELWLDNAENGSLQAARPPIQAFNAGLLQHRSFEEELKLLSQETVVLSGEGDKREADRAMYGSEMKKCELRTMEGLNVLPWENPSGIVELLRGL